MESVSDARLVSSAVVAIMSSVAMAATMMAAASPLLDMAKSASFEPKLLGFALIALAGLTVYALMSQKTHFAALCSIAIRTALMASF